MGECTQADVIDVSELTRPPRQRSISFYLVLFVAVVPIWSIVPLSWLFVIYTLRTGMIWSLGLCGKVLFAAALCEVFFSIHHYNLAKYISGPSPLPPGNTVELQAAFERVLKSGLADLSEDGFDEESLHEDRAGSPAEEIEQLQFTDPRAVDFRNYLRTWFGGVPWSSIHIQELYSWLYWSTFNAPLPPLDSIPHSHRCVLDEAVDLIQKRSGSIIPDGTNPAVKPILLTLDEVNTSLWRPFAWYAGVGISNWLLRRWYEYRWDARYGNYNGLEYLLRVPRKWNPDTDARPIVFWHGLGLGLSQYKVFLSNLMQKFADRPILVPLQPHVSQEIFHPQFLKPMGRHETVVCLVGLMEEVGWVREQRADDSDQVTEAEEQALPELRQFRQGVTMVSHSNGSYAHAWMLKAHPKMVVSSCFIDPVTFCSWEGDVCHNFIYRPCSTGIELIMRYFVSTELGVANVIQRHFDWSSNALWYEEIPHARDPVKTMFLLGGKDDVVNSERVKRYLRSHGVRDGLWFDPNGIHGQALMTGGKGHTEILRWLHQQH